MHNDFLGHSGFSVLPFSVLGAMPLPVRPPPLFPLFLIYLCRFLKTLGKFHAFRDVSSPNVCVLYLLDAKLSLLFCLACVSQSYERIMEPWWSGWEFFTFVHKEAPLFRCQIDMSRKTNWEQVNFLHGITIISSWREVQNLQETTAIHKSKLVNKHLFDHSIRIILFRPTLIQSGLSNPQRMYHIDWNIVSYPLVKLNRIVKAKFKWHTERLL